MKMEMKELLEEVIKTIVDKPDEVSINLTESENTLIYELKVGEGDVGKVIGKKGKNVGSLRTLLSAATAKAGGKRALLEIIEQCYAGNVIMHSIVNVNSKHQINQSYYQNI